MSDGAASSIFLDQTDARMLRGDGRSCQTHGMQRVCKECWSFESRSFEQIHPKRNPHPPGQLLHKVYEQNAPFPRCGVEKSCLALDVGNMTKQLFHSQKAQELIQGSAKLALTWQTATSALPHPKEFERAKESRSQT